MNNKMFENMNEQEAREKILSEVKEYAEKFHAVKPYSEGDRIPYARRVYGSEEMVNLVDQM